MWKIPLETANFDKGDTHTFVLLVTEDMNLDHVCNIKNIHQKNDCNHETLKDKSFRAV